ncbi:hypothetical protein [Frankia sp. CiP1_Cm_nod1]|uniref:hypothetical protein n=1 Tax=Frankia sp. CiP1_Cm_nod1 TaxID=2897160 RepID=UPI00202418DF
MNSPTRAGKGQADGAEDQQRAEAPSVRGSGTKNARGRETRWAGGRAVHPYARSHVAGTIAGARWGNEVDGWMRCSLA